MLIFTNQPGNLRLKITEKQTKIEGRRYATDRQYSRKLNAIIEAYDLTQYDEPKEQEKQDSETNERMDSFVVPTRWRNSSSTSSRMTISVVQSKKPFTSILSIRIKILLLFWDLWHHFSVREIPQETFCNGQEKPISHLLGSLEP